MLEMITFWPTPNQPRKYYFC